MAAGEGHEGTDRAEGPEGGGYPLTWGHWQLCHIHSSACLVGSNGVLVLLQGTEVLGGPGGLPGASTCPPHTLTIRSCMRAFRWSPLALAWAAAAWYRSIRCSRASRRFLGAWGTSGPEEVGKTGSGRGKWALARLPTSKGLSGLPGLARVEAGVKGWAAGKGGSGDSWSADRAQLSEALPGYLGPHQNEQWEKEGHRLASSPGGGGRRDRSTGSPRLRASKTGSKLCEKE